jgi:hypothetical protein
MGLSDYMIAPIQRITRYGLLLKGKMYILGDKAFYTHYSNRSFKAFWL